MSDAVWDEFRRTSVRIEITGGWFEIAPVDTADMDGYLPETSGPIHLLTAWNPQGHPADDTANEQANRRLLGELESHSNLSIVPSVGFGGGALNDDGTWREEGFAITGLDRNAAVTLAVAFDQRAIFEWRNEPGGFRLVACDGSADEPRGWRSRIVVDA